MKCRILATTAALTALAAVAQEARPGATNASPVLNTSTNAVPATATTSTNAVAHSSTNATPIWAGDWLQSAKKPASWIKFGGDLRLRHEYVLNATTLNAQAKNHELSYERFRARLATTITAVTNFDLNVRLAAEPREWYNGRTATKNDHSDGTGWDWTEGYIDQLNINYTNAFTLPMALIVGRQDMAMGEPGAPWLVADGTPIDGSRTAYFDAARAIYNIDEIHTTVDTAFVNQYAENDKWLPVMNGLDKYQIEQNERGAILYVSNKSLEKMEVDGFFMYKHEQQVTAAGANGDLYTPGGRLAGNLDKHWSYNVEGAYQTGDRNSENVSAFGVNSRMTYAVNDSLNNRFRVSYEYESGDDPNTKTYEQFDTLWGRYPRWTEAGIFYSKTEDGRPGDLSNMHRIGPGWSISPFKKADFRFDYYYLLADQNSGYYYNPTLFTKTGDERGHMMTSALKYKYNQHLSGYLLGELLFPGDYYVQNDPMVFVRAEVMYTW